MRLRKIHHYDTYVPILSQIKQRHTWDQAVRLVTEALTPLGENYVEVLRAGLAGRWCDRYPNQGKQSGAFSYGTYDGEPYILMNYKPEVLNDVFTLATKRGTRCTRTYRSSINRTSTTITRFSWRRWRVPSTSSCWPDTCWKIRVTHVCKRT